MAQSLRFCLDPNEVRTGCADPTQRTEIIEQVAESRIDFQTVASQGGKPDADTFRGL